MPVYLFIRFKGRNEKVLLAEILPADDFCRIHRSYIIALDKIRSFDRKGLLLTNEQLLPAGDEYYGRLEKSVLILDHTWSGRR